MQQCTMWLCRFVSVVALLRRKLSVWPPKPFLMIIVMACDYTNPLAAHHLFIADLLFVLISARDRDLFGARGGRIHHLSIIANYQ